MKITLKIFVWVIIFLLFFLPYVYALDHIYPVHVERVIDGDTIVVSLYLGLDIILAEQYVRLYGIDAWEIRGEEKEKGVVAKEYLEKRLEDAAVEIEIREEWGKRGKDKYGRWLGVVYANRVNINEELVEKGYAKKYEE